MEVAAGGNRTVVVTASGTTVTFRKGTEPDSEEEDDWNSIGEDVEDWDEDWDDGYDESD